MCSSDLMPAVRTASQSISGIVSAIDMIMFQTNPRALNAALEAVYAVESGRGFEVVASEARELTRRSADAAREVKQLIAEVTARIGDSARLAAESGVATKKIAAAIEEVPEAVSRIADGSGHQAARIDEVRGAKVQLEEITHQNAALVEESAAVVETMRQQSALLTSLVARFELDKAAGNLPRK